MRYVEFQDIDGTGSVFVNPHRIAYVTGTDTKNSYRVFFSGNDKDFVYIRDTEDLGTIISVLESWQ